MPELAVVVGTRKNVSSGFATKVLCPRKGEREGQVRCASLFRALGAGAAGRNRTMGGGQEAGLN
jgi:hypothetical protein